MKHVARTMIERMTLEIYAVRFRPGVTMRALAAEFECDEKTVQRDFDFMRDRLGIGLSFDKQYCTWSVNPNHHLPWLKALLNPQQPASK